MRSLTKSATLRAKEERILVLQGGGALGAYQAGVYEVLAGTRQTPSWVAGMIFPRRTIVPRFPPIPMRVPVFVAVYGVLELVLGVTGTQTGIAHFAHLGGLAGGFLFMRFWKAWR